MPTEQTTETLRPAPRPARPAVTELVVEGMTCGNCARHVTEAIQSVPGVRSAVVTLDAGRATVNWASGAEPNASALIGAVEKEGYQASLREADGENEGVKKLGGWRLNLWLGLPITLVLMAGEWVFGWGTQTWFKWVSFVLASLVQIFAGAGFYRGAWAQLKAASSNMDTLVALGSSTAFAYSVWALFAGQSGHLYFMEAAAIITLISAGHFIESRVSVRASSALRDLLQLAPALARRVDDQGNETEVPVAELGIGDTVALRPGDRVPTDGLVIEGESAVDESMLTGESVPVDKKPGAELYAGTVNLNGRLLARVTAVGETTALAHIIAAVQRAQTSRARIQRLGDRVSSVFVPVVIVIALAAALWWGLAPESARLLHERLAHFLWPAHTPESALAATFIIAAAVLIIACPCAMGLATPAAIMAGSNAAARRGILIRDAVALEKAGTITAVMFDKTGTLTVGKPSVVKVWEGGKIRNPKSEIRNKSQGGNSLNSETGAQSLAVALARHSSHPISQAVVDHESTRINSVDHESTRINTNGSAAKEGNSDLVNWQEVRGAGVQATERTPDGGSRLVRFGSLRWLRESGVDLQPGDGFIAEWSAQGATISGLAIEGSVVALFAIKDTLKPGAEEVIKELHRQNLDVYLVSGDNPKTAAAIAKQAGILPKNVFSEVRPEHKAELVSKLQREGQRVAFVGDGINDAPALEQADLGIAVCRASDIAREAADIILLKIEIQAIPESLGLARATLRTIKQNLFWAFFYNAAGIPLAALGFMSPILCAAAMGLSDLVVIGNALRLARWRLKSAGR